jgi:hypothetical protein
LQLPVTFQRVTLVRVRLDVAQVSICRLSQANQGNVIITKSALSKAVVFFSHRSYCVHHEYAVHRLKETFTCMEIYGLGGGEL